MPKRSSSLERARNQEVTLEILPVNVFQSFRCFMHDYPTLGARYCVHIEYEIHLIRKGSGHYKIGDKLGEFKSGQVFLVGSRVPHDWVSDLRKNQVIRDRDLVIQFSREWLEKVKKNIPEIADFELLLDHAQRVIVFHGDTSKAAGEILETITEFSGMEQVIKLLEVLLIMSDSGAKDREYILEDSYQTDSEPLSQLAAEKGVAYIFNNIEKKIRLSDAAKLAFMSPSTFSRIFKKASGLNFSEMVRKLRIEHGCKLLCSTDLSIATISKESGFTNLSNFNRQFLREMEITPRNFRGLNKKQRTALLERVFGHKNRLLQQAKIDSYMTTHSNQISEFMSQVQAN